MPEIKRIKNLSEFRLLDIALAEHLDGRKWWHTSDSNFLFDADFNPVAEYPVLEFVPGFDENLETVITTPFGYSSELYASWTIVEKMQALGWNFAIRDGEKSVGNGWRAMFDKPADGLQHDGVGATPEEAICRAALDALGVKMPRKDTD